jgi:hypothetical protein
MQINRNNLQHITSVQHQGLVFLFGIDDNRDLYYAVRRPPTAPTQEPSEATEGAESTETADEVGPAPTMPATGSVWREWVRLPLPTDSPDLSVIQREREEGTAEWVRSQYNTARRTALAPIQVLSDGEHLFVFRQSTDNTLLVDRFLLDGGTERLVPKLEVRFKRSRQRFTPAQPQGFGGNQSFDTPDFRDFSGNFFFEPTQEIRLTNPLTQGWFSVVLTNTTEHDVNRWHLFTHNRDTERIELFSIRRSADRLFDLRDYTVEEGTLEDPQPRHIPGLIKRTLILRNEEGAELRPTQAPVATRFCLQSEMLTQDGDPSYVKAGVRVMLAVPVQSGEAAADTADSTLASLVFGVRTDGTLAQIDDGPQETLLQESNQDILLPADRLQQIRPVSDDEAGAAAIDDRPSFTFDGIDDYIDVGSDRTLNVARNFSIEAWVWPAVEKEQWILAKQGSYGLGLVNGNPVFTTDDGQRYQMEDVTIPTATWTHIAVVLDRRHTLSFYVNGELADTYEDATAARSSQSTVKIGVLDPESESGFWEGFLAEVRIWNTALLPAEIQQRLGDRLLGREAGLVGYWPLLSVANGETVDFSPESNTGTVFGAFPTGRRLPRRVGRRNADAYRYAEVFPVIQGATYLETFEYRTDDPIRPFDEAAEAFDFVFEGLMGGRNGDPTEPVIVPAQIRPLDADNDDGWRVAQARFTIPEGMTHLRYFHITRPGGGWDTLEVRRHRIAQLASTVTQAEFVDEVTLSTLADTFADAEAELDRLIPLEQEEARLAERLRSLEAQLASADPEQALRAAIDRQRSVVSRLDNQVSLAQRRLNTERENPFNRYAYLSPRALGAGDFTQRLRFLGNTPFLTRPVFDESEEWALVVVGNDAGMPIVRIHHRSNENLLLTAPLNRDRTGYTPLLVLSSTNSSLFDQLWQVQFITFGRSARVQLRVYRAGRPQFNLAPGVHLLVRRLDNSLPILPATEVIRGNNGIAEWFLFDINPEPGQNLHPAGSRLITQLTAELEALTRDRDAAQVVLEQLQADLENVSNLSAIRDQVRLELLAVREQIRAIRAAYLAAIAALSQEPQALPLIPTTSGGTVQGALLGFASPAGAVTAYESVEAAVHLNFWDRRGRLRPLPYSAVDEVWQPSVPGVCLELQADATAPAYVSIPQVGAALALAAGLNAFTWAAWVRSTELNDGAAIAAYGTADNGWQITSPRNLRVTINGNTSPATDVAIGDGNWHHLAVAWESQTGQLTIAVDGQQRYSGELAPNAVIAQGQPLSFGATPSGGNAFVGFLEAIQLWGVALSPDEIQAHQHLPLSGNEPGLLGYWPLEDLNRDQILDRSGNNYHGTLTGQIQLAPSTAPIGRLDTTATAVIANEYPTQEVGPAGESIALMRRFYAFLQADTVSLLQDQRLETLEVRWVGNAQFEPTLLGYIEGAPPVPSENLTLEDTYDGAAAVQLTSTEEVSYSWTRSQEAGLGFDIEAIFGSAGSVEVGLFVTTQIDAGVGFTGSISGSYSLLDEGTTTLDVANIFQDRLALRGEVEATPQFPLLGQRYVPKNVGYALVASSLADVFVLRLQRSRRMVSYQVAPVPDLPPQVNTITFLINPAYQQNGTLDGQVGTAAADDRIYAQVPEQRAQFGSRLPASYFRIQEAASLQAELQRQDREREAIFFNYNSRAIAAGEVNRVSDDVNEDNIEEIGAGAANTIESDFDRSFSGGESAGWQRRLEQLRVAARKRNIVNTYVWDGDGGLRSETQEFADTIEQTIGGSFALDGSLGVTGFIQGGGAWVELTALATASLTQVSTKTESRSRGFSLEVEVEGESRGITRLDDTPVLPGEKVDRYRFSSFYLEPRTGHFNDFFHQVVDPEWLMGNDEEARALRQISLVRPNPVWRVRHLVTFVERPALQGVGVAPAALTISPAAIAPTPNGNGRQTVAAAEG